MLVLKCLKSRYKARSIQHLWHYKTLILKSHFKNDNNGKLWSLFVSLSFLRSNHIDFSGIRIWIFRVESEHASPYLIHYNSEQGEQSFELQCDHICSISSVTIFAPSQVWPNLAKFRNICELYLVIFLGFLSIGQILNLGTLAIYYASGKIFSVDSGQIKI